MSVNKDLQYERRRCTFDPIELTHFWDGSPEKTEQRRELEQFILSDPEFVDNVPVNFKSHKEVYQDAIRKSCMLLQKIRELQSMGKDSIDMYSQVVGASIGTGLIKEGSPLVIHYAMFIPAILGQGTIDQQAHWLSKSWDGSIIGTYAQTELGHGTFIRGLETTATYDPQTQEFVLNSPTLTSYKWWPGGLGHTANYAIVVAQLYTQGECKGIHTFVVQIRDENTHEPLPGIKVGEIGTKLGMNGTNNGFLGFENVRIPRGHMLMKNCQVLEDGTYVKALNDKLTYGTMVFVRVMIVRDIAHYLSKAAVITTRYSLVRRQGQINSEKPEVQIIDYLTQQYKIFPHIAACFAFQMTADAIWNMYNIVTDELDKGELDKLPQLHALSCCLKAVASADTANAIEQLRLACGGHGYMDASGLPALYSLVTAICTYEGENTVLLLQTARYLVKAWKQAGSGQPLPESMQYLTVFSKGFKQAPWKNTLQCIIEAYQAVVAGKIRLATENIDFRIGKGAHPEDAWNETSLELVQCADAYCRAFVVEKFIEGVQRTNVSKELYQVLSQLCELYAVYWILQKRGDFLQFSSLKNKNIPQLQSRLEELLIAIRPNAIGIVDGFDIRDELLNSALGAYDGDAYTRLFAEAMKSPLNQKSVNESFEKYLKPFLKSNL